MYLIDYSNCVPYYVCSRYRLYDMYQTVNPAAFCTVKKVIEREVTMFWLSASTACFGLMQRCAEAYEIDALCTTHQ